MTDFGILNAYAGAGSVPPWLLTALADFKSFDVRERPGPNDDHPRILKYFQHTTYHGLHDEVAWCSAAVCCWLEESGWESTHSAAARSYEKFGYGIERPQPGAIAVYWRGASPADWRGHVGIWLARAGPESDLILGGNQSDAVTLRDYDRDRLLCWRWPAKETE